MGKCRLKIHQEIQQEIREAMNVRGWRVARAIAIGLVILVADGLLVTAIDEPATPAPQSLSGDGLNWTQVNNSCFGGDNVQVYCLATYNKRHNVGGRKGKGEHR